ncbi:hypothetical protein ACFFHI_30595 [Streptomyces palmae]|uniref:hypothetical protein n=1 Tax=Streptomyces palmae TaxID=1701085 RepID=UPI0035E8069F
MATVLSGGLVAGLLVTGAGCSAPGSSRSAVVEGRSGQDAAAELHGAADVLVRSGSSRVRTTVEMATGGTRVAVRGRGDYDFGRRRGRLRLVPPRDAAGEAEHAPVIELLAPGALFLRNRGAGVPADKWVRVDTAGVPDGNLVTGGATDPLTAAELLRAARGVRLVGEERLGEGRPVGGPGPSTGTGSPGAAGRAEGAGSSGGTGLPGGAPRSGDGAGRGGGAGPDGGSGAVPGADAGPRPETGPEGSRGPAPETGPAGDRGTRPETGVEGDRGPEGDGAPRSDADPDAETGPEAETGRGTRVRHFRGVTDLGRAARVASVRVRGALRAAARGFTEHTVAFDAYLDERGRLRKVRYRFRVAGVPTGGRAPGAGRGQAVASTTELYDFGVRVAVRLPAPEDIYTGTVGSPGA